MPLTRRAPARNVGENEAVNDSQTSRTPLAGVFGGGGLFGIGYALGVLDGLKARGIDLADSPMLGTSAGSWAAAAVALEVPFEKFVELKVPRFPNPRPGALADAARHVFGMRSHPNVSVVVCELPRLRRKVLSGADTPLSLLVSASSSVPGLLAPQRIGNTRYLDGGVRSAVSVDLAAPADMLVVIAPLAGAMFGPFGGIVDKRTRLDIDAWTRAHHGHVMLFAPNDSGANLARRPDQLFRKQVALDAYEVGRAQALEQTR